MNKKNKGLTIVIVALIIIWMFNAVSGLLEKDGREYKPYNDKDNF